MAPTVAGIAPIRLQFTYDGMFGFRCGAAQEAQLVPIFWLQTMKGDPRVEEVERVTLERISEQQEIRIRLHSTLSR
jgi:hypothetical protein